ncbi:MAG: kynureninase [Candidatus Puniceispirillaceae bacterium]
MDNLSLGYAQARDAIDRFADKRAEFLLPHGVIYLDGNSLGPLTHAASKAVQATLHSEWGTGLIRSWNDADWINLPETVGAKIAPLIGTSPENVIMADSTSVNLFKVLSAACAIQTGRKTILTERLNFPTDNYIAEGVIRQMGHHHRLRYVEQSETLTACLDDDVAVVLLTHVNYRTGQMHDMAAISKAAHDRGALVIWDLAHSAGAVPLDLEGNQVDFAVGCGYKYLNGGPGAPAFLYVSDRYLSELFQPLTGWFAHKSPFAFDAEFTPSYDIRQYLCGTPPVLSAIALNAALDIWQNVDIHDVRTKSLALTDYLINLVEARCAGHGLQLITPIDHQIRGSQISFTHPEAGYPIIAALIAEGVIGDFRAPDILRFGVTPLYTSFADLWWAVDRLAAILDERRWDQPQFHQQKEVT